MRDLLKYSGTGFILWLVFLAACTKIKPEITSFDVSRLFSPVDLEARVINKTSVRLTWKEVSKATGYAVEVYSNGDLDFSGIPVRTIADITMDDLPLIIPGLDGETKYSVRVKALGVSIDDSKWVGAAFTTDPEQLFQPVDLADIEATSVTLKWTAGEAVTHIALLPGNITREVTPQEISEGKAVIIDLTGETAYTASLLNGTKVRGSIAFTTLIDLGGATQVNPEDDLAVILSGAKAGDVLALMPGNYNIPSLDIVHSVSIKGARPAEKPVLKGTILHVKEGVALALKDLILDGTGSDGNQAIVYDDAGNNESLSVEDCEIFNYTKGLIYVNKATLIQSVEFKNNLIYNIECNGGDFIDFRQGLAGTFEFTNNTVYNSALARDLFRMDAGGSGNFPSVNSMITIRNNTFYEFCRGSGRRVLYIRLANHQIDFSRNILAESEGIYTNQAATTIQTMNGNNYFNAPNYTGGTSSGVQNDAGPYTMLNPGFANPAAGNFTISNEELKLNNIGDARWIK